MSLERFVERKADVTCALHDLSRVADGIGAKTLGCRLREEAVPKLEAERFHLVVVGEFNHGKTTLVNALLGNAVLPTGVTPTTAVIHHIEYSPSPFAKLVRAHEPAEIVDFEKLREWTAPESEQKTVDARVLYIEIGYPAKLLEERMVLVDTPGVNDLSLQRADITYSYIPRSDAVLFLLDAGQLLKESERVFLFEKLLAKSRDKIVFVVTKSDIWSTDERSEAMAYVQSQLSKLIKKPVLFAVSAEQALRGGLAESGLPELVDHLTDFLANERGRILLDHALAEGLNVAHLLDRGVHAKRCALTMSQEDLDRRIALISHEKEGKLHGLSERRSAIREEIASIKAWSRRDLDTFCEDVIRQIPSWIEQSPAEDIRHHLSAFLESSFREWAQAETQEITKALEALAEKTVALMIDDAKDAGERLREALEMKPPSMDVDTFAYDIGVFALLTIGVGTMFANMMLGGMLTLAAPLLALYVRDKVDIEIRKRAKELAPAALREAAIRIVPMLDERISEVGAQLDAWVIATGEEIHRELLEVLQTIREERRTQETGNALVLPTLEAQSSALSAVRRRLEALRAALWVDSTIILSGAKLPRQGAREVWDVTAQCSKRVSNRRHERLGPSGVRGPRPRPAAE